MERFERSKEGEGEGNVVEGAKKKMEKVNFLADFWVLGIGISLIIRRREGGG